MQQDDTREDDQGQEYPPQLGTAPQPGPSAAPPAPGVTSQQAPQVASAPEDGRVVVEGITYRPAGFMPRLWAFLIDFVILSAFHALLLAFMNYQAPDEAEMLDLMSRLFSTLLAGGLPQGELLAKLEEIQRITRIVGWLNVAVCAAYYTVFHAVAGATLGKLCLGLTVLTARGHKLGYGTALLRYLIRLLLSRVFFGGVFTVWFDPKRRTVYDMVAGTNVFKPVPLPVDEIPA